MGIGIKEAGHKAGHLPWSSAEYEHEWDCSSIPPYVFMARRGTAWPFWMKSVRSGSSLTFVATKVTCQRGINCIIIATSGDSVTKRLLRRSEGRHCYLLLPPWESATAKLQVSTALYLEGFHTFLCPPTSGFRAVAVTNIASQRPQ